MGRNAFRGPLVGLFASIALTTGLIARASDGPPPADEPPPLSPLSIEPDVSPAKGPKNDAAVAPASVLAPPSPSAKPGLAPTPETLPPVFSFLAAETSSSLPTSVEGLQKESRSYVAMAKAHFDQGNYRRAHEYYTQAVECDPTNIPAHVGIVRMLCVARRTPEALAYLDQFVASYPNLAGEAHATRAFVRVYAAQDEDKAALEAARSDLEQAEKRGSILPIGRLARALLARRESRLDDASRDLDWLIENQDETVDVLIERAVVRRRKGDIPGALSDLARADSLHPGWLRPMLLWTRGKCFADCGEHDRAIADFTDAMPGYPGNTELFAGRAACYQAKGDVDHALADYDEIVRRRPEAPESYLARGIVLLAKGEKARAMADMDRLVQLMPRSWAVYFYRGVVSWIVSDDRAKAKADFDQALKLDPRLSLVYAIRGCLEGRDFKLVPACLDFGRFVLTYESTEYYVGADMDWEGQRFFLCAGWHHKDSDPKDGPKKFADIDAQCLDMAFRQLFSAAFKSS